MPLKDCIAKIKNISKQDIAFLEQELADGKSEQEAMDALEENIQAGVDQLVKVVEDSGGTVLREGDPERATVQSALAQAEEDRKWAKWRPSWTTTGKVNGAPEWVNRAKDPKKALLKMERELTNRIKEGLAGREWYEESTRRVMDIVGGNLIEAEKLIQLIAIYSPQANVQVNTGFAVKAWNQYKRNEPITASNNTVKDGKATAALYENQPFAGRKIGSFYGNLMYDLLTQYPKAREILTLDKEMIDAMDSPVTIDMWMARAFGFNSDAIGDDKGSGKYSFSENYLRRITARLNKRLEPGEDRWTPHQVQAAIWTSMKARYELPHVKSSTNRESTRRGLSRKVKGSYERVNQKPKTIQAHLKIWRKWAMQVTGAEATEFADTTAASFETFLDQMTEVVTWEVIPSTQLGHNINKASPTAQRAFHRDALSVIVGEDGIDELAAMLGVPLNYVRSGIGAYEGVVNPNYLSHLIPEKGDGEFSRDQVRAYARAIQYIYKQNAVPWFRADSRALLSKKAQDEQLFRVINTKNNRTVSKGKFETLAEAQALAASKGEGFEVRGGKYAFAQAFRFKEKLSAEDREYVLKSLQSVLGPEAGFTMTAPNEVSIINFRDDETGVPFLDDQEFDLATDLFADLIQEKGLDETLDFWSEGEYGQYQDFTADSEGSALLEADGLKGRSDLQAWLRGRREQYEALLEDYSAKNIEQREVEARQSDYLAQRTAYHGTGAETLEGNRLSTKYIGSTGSGTGQTNFGWGLYFASSEAMGEGWRKDITDVRGGEGGLYKVDLLPEDNELLDWDRPVAEQPQRILDIILAASDRTLEYWQTIDFSGGDFYNMLVRDSALGTELEKKKEVSLTLLALGIKGNKFRNPGQAGWKNEQSYVIFDDNQVEIIDRLHQSSVFYSALERAAKGLQQKKGSGKQMLAMLKKQPGVKAEELEWLGVDQYLEGQDTVTKNEIIEFIESGGVMVTDVTYGGDTSAMLRPLRQDYAIATRNAIEAVTTEDFMGADTHDEALSRVLADENWQERYGVTNPESIALLNRFREMSQEISGARTRTQVKYQQYTLSGGEDYREMVLTLPEQRYKGKQRILGEPTAYTIEEAADKLGMYPDDFQGAAEVLIYDKQMNYIQKMEDGRYWTIMGRDEFISDDLGEVESWLADQTAAEMDQQEINYRSSHWKEPNVIAHIRFNTREIDGKNTLFIEEIQSDWHQAGRKHGYQMKASERESKRKELKAQMDVIDKQMEEIWGPALLERKAEVEAGTTVDWIEIEGPDGFPRLQAEIDGMAAEILWAPEEDGENQWAGLLEANVYASGRSMEEARAAMEEFLREREDSQLDPDIFSQIRAHSGPAYDKLNADEMVELQVMMDTRDDVFVSYERLSDDGGVPDGPFKKTWPLLSMKRMIRYAAENGFDQIAWTTGEQQASRYSQRDERAEGMKGFYDKMLPNQTSKYIKKLGAEVHLVPMTKVAPVVEQQLAIPVPIPAGRNPYDVSQADRDRIEQLAVEEGETVGWNQAYMVPAYARGELVVAERRDEEFSEDGFFVVLEEDPESDVDGPFTNAADAEVAMEDQYTRPEVSDRFNVIVPFYREGPTGGVEVSEVAMMYYNSAFEDTYTHMTWRSIELTEWGEDPDFRGPTAAEGAYAEYGPTVEEANQMNIAADELFNEAGNLAGEEFAINRTAERMNEILGDDWTSAEDIFPVFERMRELYGITEPGSDHRDRQIEGLVDQIIEYVVETRREAAADQAALPAPQPTAPQTGYTGYLVMPESVSQEFHETIYEATEQEGYDIAELLDSGEFDFAWNDVTMRFEFTNMPRWLFDYIDDYRQEGDMGPFQDLIQPTAEGQQLATAAGLPPPVELMEAEVIDAVKAYAYGDIDLVEFTENIGVELRPDVLRWRQMIDEIIGFNMQGTEEENDAMVSSAVDQIMDIAVEGGPPRIPLPTAARDEIQRWATAALTEEDGTAEQIDAENNVFEMGQSPPLNIDWEDHTEYLHGADTQERVAYAINVMNSYIAGPPMPVPGQGPYEIVMEGDRIAGPFATFAEAEQAYEGEGQGEIVTIQDPGVRADNTLREGTHDWEWPFTITGLTDWYTQYLESQGLPQVSADEHEGLSLEQAAVINEFSDRWVQAQEREDASRIPIRLMEAIENERGHDHIYDWANTHWNPIVNDTFTARVPVETNIEGDWMVGTLFVNYSLSEQPQDPQAPNAMDILTRDDVEITINDMSVGDWMTREDIETVGLGGPALPGVPPPPAVRRIAPIPMVHAFDVTDEMRKTAMEGQSLFQDKLNEEDERARFFPNVDGQRVIQLTEASDLSSFLHEGSHLFLDVQRVWVKKYGMNDNQKAMLKWLGARDFDSITVEQHETWAETFEVYLREGKAPSIGLRRAFASFASWLKRIYRVLTDPRLARAKLDDEITGIFDRILATQEEIEMAALRPEYAQLFQSKEQAGMTDAQWEKYQKNQAKKQETAEMTLDEKVIKQYKRMKSKEWADEKKPLAAQEAERIGQEPVYQLLSEARVVKDKNGKVISDGRVDWHKLQKAVGGLPGGKLGTVGGGVDPGLYADKYGFASVKDMYEQIKAVPSLKDAADQAAEQIMIAKHGDILNDGTLEAEVREAMLNEEQAEQVIMELKAEGNANAQRIDRATLKHQAEMLIGSYTYKEIRPARFYNAMIKAAKAAATAEDPTQDKIQQLANHYLYRAAMDAKSQMDKDRKKVRSVQTRIAAGKYNTNQVDQQYIEAMGALASAYDMRLTPKERAEYGRRVLDFYAGQTNPENENAELFGLELLDPNLVAAIRYRNENGNLDGFVIKTFDEMTVEEMGGVIDMLNHLRYVGGQVANKGAAEDALMREAGLESIEENGGKDFPVQRGKQRRGKMARLTWGDFWSTMSSLGNMVRKLDGFKDGGWAFENIYKPIQAAIDHKMTMQIEMFKQMEDFMAEMPNVGLRKDDAVPFTKENGMEDDFSSEEIFMMAVYWGTESSREALMQGHELSENDVQTLLNQLTPPQLELVNQVWAMNESQWPKLQEAAKLMLGVAPPKLAAAPFIVNGVEMTGGHMQLMYDSQALELADEAMRGMNTANVVPMRQGSTHARKGSAGRPVLLDTGNITQSMEEKTHYIAFASVGRQLRAILNNKDIQNTIEKKHGSPFYEALIQSITAVSRAEPARETSRWIARVSRWTRQSATLMHLGYSLRNVMQQFPAALISAREVGPIKFTQSSGLFASNPKKFMDEINEKSAMMRDRKQVINRDSREAMKKILSTTKGEKYWNQVKSASFVLQTLVDSTVAYPTWHAKYTDSIKKHGDEKRAIIEANQTVAETVGSGHDVYLGRIMQSNQSELVKSLTMFGSWFNAYYQRLYKSSKGGTNFLSAAFLMDAVVMPIIVANLTQMVIGDWPDDDEEVEDYVVKNSFNFMIATLPLIRELSGVIEGFTPSAPISAIPTALVRIPREFASYAEGRQTGLKLAADVGRTVGTVVPLPGSGNVWRMFDYLDSYLQGEEGDTFNPYLALTEGRDKDK